MGKAVSTMGKVADDDVLAGRISVVASLRNVTVVAALRFADPLSEFLEQVAAAGMVTHGINQTVGSALAGLRSSRRSRSMPSASTAWPGLGAARVVITARKASDWTGSRQNLPSRDPSGSP